jgi:hypothetical protein
MGGTPLQWPFRAGSDLHADRRTRIHDSQEKSRPKPGFLVSALHAGVAAGPGAARAARTTLSWSAWP